jgi:hypothetical protein
MATAATIAARLILDQSDYDAGLTSAGKKAKTFQQQMKDVGSSMTRVGGIMTAAVTIPVVAGFNSMANAASDLTESANAVNVVFEDAAGVIHEFGKTAATEVGLAESEFNQLAAVTGAFLTNLGYDQAAAADETLKLTNRAADMASIFNTDVSQALEAIQSGLKGEFNPLEQFGVKMNAADIQARAMAMGLADANGELDNNAKAMAALAIFYEQTDKLAGDFKNTSDGLANSSRIMKAEMANLSAELGTLLLPYFKEGVKLLRVLIGFFSSLPAPVQKVILGVLLLAAVLGPIILIIGSVIGAIGSIMTVLPALGTAFAAIGAAITGTLLPAIGAVITALAPVLIPILLIIAVLALLYLAWKNNWFGIRDITAQVWEKLKAAFASGVEFVKKVWESLQPAIQFVLKYITTIVKAWQALFRGDFYEFGRLLRQAWDMLWNLMITILKNAWVTIKNVAKSIVDGILAVFKIDWSQVGKNIVQGIINGIDKLRGWAVDKMRSMARGMADAFNGFFGIRSPATWSEERAEYIRKGFEREWNSSPITMTPTPVLSSMPTPGTSSVGGGQMMSSNAEIITLLRQLVSQGSLDINQLTRSLRDAILIAKD